ncbi:hypothetical protein [Streptococcus ovuberis]|uniref:Uncharacterized protein n=1 Tax=Streptococcus ovuberis TaxID=1936207 RepID=A0A7X6S1H6_9STRE|nr:hypothetical protein [Streptococcus ovuberis]NKZ21184.1 hypothetical protein [Streptococcus ovuberis]
MPLIMTFTSPMTLEDLIDRYYSDGLTNIDHILHFEDTPQVWTVDEDSQMGDTIFFTCAENAVAHMARLVAEIASFEGQVEDFDQVLAYAKNQQNLYETYAGQLLAVGRLASPPFQRESPGYAFAAWSNPWYAKVSDFRRLTQPLLVSAFSDFIIFSETSSRTYLTDDQYRQLSLLVLEHLDFQLKLKED